RRAARPPSWAPRAGACRASRATGDSLKDLRAPWSAGALEAAACGRQCLAAQLAHAAGAGELLQRQAAEVGGAELGGSKLEVGRDRRTCARRGRPVPAQRPP